MGLLARDVGTLRAGVRALDTTLSTSVIESLVVIPELAAFLDPGMEESFAAALQALVGRKGLGVRTDESVTRVALDAWFASFRAIQAHEAWQVNRELLEMTPDAVSQAVRQRVLAGSEISADDLLEHWDVLAAARAELRGLMAGGSVVCLPTVSGAPARVDAPAKVVEGGRARTLRLTTLASLAGLPALSAPLMRIGGHSTGLSLVGSPGSELALIDAIDESCDVRIAR